MARTARISNGRSIVSIRDSIRLDRAGGSFIARPSPDIGRTPEASFSTRISSTLRGKATALGAPEESPAVGDLGGREVAEAAPPRSPTAGEIPPLVFVGN